MGTDNVGSRKTYSEIFEEMFPFYLSIGMSYREFWQDDPCLAYYYRKADHLKQQRKNQELWLQGMYVYNAIGAFVEILPAFPKKGAKIQPYMEEPIPLTVADMEERKARKQQQKMEQIKRKMMARSLEINARKGGFNQ